MSQPVVLITGCSSGIGKALALEFHKKQCKVYASARNIEKLQDLKTHGIEVVELDVTDQTSMQVMQQTQVELPHKLAYICDKESSK